MDFFKNFNLNTPIFNKPEVPKTDDNDGTKEPEKPKTPPSNDNKTPGKTPPKSKSTLGDINVLDYLLADEEPAPPSTRGIDETSETSETAETEETQETNGVSKTETAPLSTDVEHMTEAEAIEQGYTVIKTAQDLAAIGSNLSGKYIIMNDIDLSDVEWTPLGSDEEPFVGILNGNGYKIKNLNINAQNGTSTENVGFFAAASNAEISNITLENVNIQTPESYNKGSVGALIGHAENIKIDNVTVSGKVSGHQKLGGLIGTLSTGIPAANSYITNTSVNADVNGSYYAGGLIGSIETFSSGCNVMIENTYAGGNVSADKKCAGGFIGEAGSTIVTINKSTSAVNVTGVDGAQRIGGFIGCANGTKIAICNSDYKGTISAQGDFQGKHYGYYMNDAHVSIFELSAGLPADDILKIDGVDGLTPIFNDTTGEYEYEVTVSTLTGLDKVVAMIQQNPDLAKIVTFNVNFDFEKMDGQYSPSVYAQYGVVQHQYEDEEGNVVNDVYIDNEIDTETTFHSEDFVIDRAPRPVNIHYQFYEETMVEGLFKDQNGNYFVSTAYGMIPTSLAFFFEQQRTNVETRLDEDEVEYREYITNMVKDYQRSMRDVLKDFFNYDGKSSTIIGEPEYEYLKSKQQSGEQLSDIEALQFNIYELDMKIIDIVNKVTHNEGCGMGGDSSFLEETTAIPLYDENGEMRYQSLGGTELRQQKDEEGNPLLDVDGNPLYQDLEGKAYEGNDPVFIKRGYPKTDEQGRFMYTDEEGSSVFRTENEDGSFSYTKEDGSAFEGDTESLKQQLDEYDIGKEFSDLQNQMAELLKEYQEKYAQA